MNKKTIEKNNTVKGLSDDFKQKDRRGNVIPPDKIRRYGRKVRGLPYMSVVSPYIMRTRQDSSNYIRDTIRIERLEDYIRQKRVEGLTNLTLMHVLIAAYIRVVSQRPAINRFIQGQRIYARKNVEISLVIKKTMSLDSQDTALKMYFYPDATIYDVYNQINDAVEGFRNAPGGNFEETVKLLAYVPGLALKAAVGGLRFLDYFGMLPRFLTKLSPFHGSFFITSMGSLGIPPIYHHLYDFGNLPVFMSFGAKYRKNVVLDDGRVEKQSFVDYTFVTDERICDGFYFASGMKLLRSILKNPLQLDNPPETVVMDIK
ncbi:MAG: hypothetical protein IKT46_00305 [Clostridia bacterium]|nr:hypothetical protein [Clostridia bacterium]